MPTNDNVDLRGQPAYPADSHGQAALVLVECLVHGLVNRNVLSTDDAIDIVGSAIEVQADVAEAADGAGPAMWKSHWLLSAMSASLQHDANGR